MLASAAFDAQERRRRMTSSPPNVSVYLDPAGPPDIAFRERVGLDVSCTLHHEP